MRLNFRIDPARQFANGGVEFSEIPARLRAKRFPAATTSLRTPGRVWKIKTTLLRNRFASCFFVSAFRESPWHRRAVLLE
jgi:hypothetical protein